MAAFTLEKLEKIVSDRASASEVSSYTATLLSCGIEKCAQKMGEEAIETVIAATSRDKNEVRKESADLLYHLLVVLNASGVTLQSVLEELDARTAQSGLEEKASRKQP